MSLAQPSHAISPDPPSADQQFVFETLNLDTPGLEEARAAWEAGEWERAWLALMAFYARQPLAERFAEKVRTHDSPVSTGPEALLENEFVFQDLRARNRSRPDGGLDWEDRGPHNDIEWAFFLNRHYYFFDALRYYQASQDPRFVQYVADHLRDWMAQYPLPDGAIETPQWRVLEAARRVGGTWPPAFYLLLPHEAFSPAMQQRMLRAVVEHCRYIKSFHTPSGNHAAMELKSLAEAALFWPQFKEAAEWFDYGANQLKANLDQCVYPDGVQKELACMYHRLVLDQYRMFISNADEFNAPVPPALRERIGQMVEYLAWSMNPRGFGLHNNDSDLEDNRAYVLRAARQLDRPDLAYIATLGQEGREPQGPPSRLYPWAGHVLMRSAWSKDAHFLFFDAGPFGISHQHHDSLNVTASAYGRDVLVDCGRYSYRPGRFRDYFTLSQSHNVILVDGHGQKPPPRQSRRANRKIAGEGKHAVFARGVFKSGFEGMPDGCTHTRAVLYLKDWLWIVVDSLDLPRKANIQALWHFHPACTVKRQGHRVGSADPGTGNLQIIPATPEKMKWRVHVVRGKRFPVQGWWSQRYYEKQPAPCAIYKARVGRRATFAWALLPFQGAQAPGIDVRLIKANYKRACLEIIPPGRQALHLAVRLDPRKRIQFTDGEEYRRDYVIGEVAGGRVSVIDSGNAGNLARE